jgi:cell fate (sporulation/competence/biofilm development) regulator YmcA (YheA/YmcA/DUF963 family)
VEENRRNELDAKLKEMIKHFEQAEAKRNEPKTVSGAGNAIRRREGESVLVQRELEKPRFGISYIFES